MPTLNELLAQRAEIETQIQAQKVESVAGIRAQMQALGITLADLGGIADTRRTGGNVGSKRPVKYRDDKGNAWTGVGQRPRWLRSAIVAGYAIESFAVKP